MDSIFPLCQFQNGPITDENYVAPLNALLRAEVSPTVTTKDVELYKQQLKKKKSKLSDDNTEETKEDKEEENQEEEEEEEDDFELETTGTTPLHAICAALDPAVTPAELETVCKMIDTLFEWGAGWMICKFSTTPLHKFYFRTRS